MKEILPVVIIIAISIVSSLLKRKDKEGTKQTPKKHNPGNGRPVVVPAKPTVSQPTPILVEERVDPFNPYEDRYERQYAEPQYKPMQAESMNPERTLRVDYGFEERNWEEEIADEVANNRIIHTPHNHKKFRVEHAEEKHGFHFDMQNAIIQEAILNRPQH